MKKDFKMPFEESGITLNFPDENYFCFENCRGYQELSGFHFKEMDACWFDFETNQLYIIELKDYTGNKDLESEIELNDYANNKDLEDKAVKKGKTIKNIANFRAWDLIKKSIDSIFMLHSVLLATEHSKKISACFPENINLKDFNLKLIHIINCDEKQENIQFLRDSFLDKIKAYNILFKYDIKFLTYEQAKKHLSNFVQ